MKTIKEFDYARQTDFNTIREDWTNNMTEKQYDSRQKIHEMYYKEDWSYVLGDFTPYVDVLFNENKKKLAVVFCMFPGVDSLSVLEIENVADATDAFYKKISIMSLLMYELKKKIPVITIKDWVENYNNPT
jgi:hypothetical protein